MADRDWKVNINNYDNILVAFFVFFQISTEESWPDFMRAAIDTSGYDMGPITNNRPAIALIYISFLSITSFFVMNLFDSVIVDKFNEEIKKREGLFTFTAE